MNDSYPTPERPWSTAADFQQAEDESVYLDDTGNAWQLLMWPKFDPASVLLGKDDAPTPLWFPVGEGAEHTHGQLEDRGVTLTARLTPEHEWRERLETAMEAVHHAGEDAGKFLWILRELATGNCLVGDPLIEGPAQAGLPFGCGDCAECRAADLLKQEEGGSGFDLPSGSDGGQSSSADAKQKGIISKFHVTRVDGKDAPGEKHHGCWYWCLDPRDDPFSIPALLAYADACEDGGFAKLAAELRGVANLHQDKNDG